MPTPKEHWGYTIEEWQKAEFQSIVNQIPDIKIFWDIGANVGGVAEIIKRRIPEVSIHCFEPVLVNYEELVRNVPYATCHQFGIYYGAKESKVLWRGSNDGAYFVEQINSGEPRIQTGEVMILKELEELDLEKPDLIKLDVEGAEENILEHSHLVKKTPYLIIEWHPNTEPINFFAKHLPNHRVVVNLSDKQFLLCLK